MNLAECHGTTRALPRTMYTLLILMLTMAAGCRQTVETHQVGDRIELGGVVYTVQEADWETEIQTGGGTRTPQHRFLVIRLTISNKSNKEVTLPLLNAVKGGAETLELSEGLGLDDWLGILRTLNPTETKTGRIVFDMPMGSYSLRITDGGEPEKERTAMVALPDKPKEGISSPLLNQPAPQSPGTNQ